MDDGPGIVAMTPFSENPDPHELHRFLAAQEEDYATALAELRAGRKRSHWMWYVFPQYAGLGYSATSQLFAIKSVAEAEAYLRHPVLGHRLVECCETVMRINGSSAMEVFGSPDDMKLRSCATLFAAVAPAGSIFQKVLDKFFAGQRDDRTVQLMDRPAS
jgi:uncharacterized protein (DUF1810 family)